MTFSGIEKEVVCVSIWSWQAKSSIKWLNVSKEFIHIYRLCVSLIHHCAISSYFPRGLLPWSVSHKMIFACSHANVANFQSSPFLAALISQMSVDRKWCLQERDLLSFPGPTSRVLNSVYIYHYDCALKLLHPAGPWAIPFNMGRTQNNTWTETLVKLISLENLILLYSIGYWDINVPSIRAPIVLISCLFKNQTSDSMEMIGKSQSMVVEKSKAVGQFTPVIYGNWLC